MKIFKELQQTLYAKVVLSISILFLILLGILPFKISQLVMDIEIFPAIEFIILFQLMRYKLLKNWQLFLIGICLDQLYQIVIGITSISLISVDIILKYYQEKIKLINYNTNILIFYLYFLYILMVRFLILSLKSAYYFEITSIIFYYFTTILSYPLIAFLIQRPINILQNYGRK